MAGRGVVNRPRAAVGPDDLAEELEHQPLGALRVVHERPVPAAIKDLHAGARERIALPLGEGHRQVGVVPPPEHQDRTVQRPQHLTEPDACLGRVVGGPVQSQDGPLGARIAGLCYLMVIAGGLYAEVFVRASLLVPGDAAATARAIAANETLWRWGWRCTCSTWSPPS